MLLRIGLIFTLSLLIAVPVFAADLEPGTKAGNWISNNVNGLIPGVLIMIGVYFLVTRDWVKMASFLLIAIAVGMLMNWENVKKIGNSLWTTLFGY